MKTTFNDAFASFMGRIFTAAASIMLSILCIISCSKDGNGSSSSGNAPDVPSGLEIRSQGTNSATISWTAVPGADKYDWQMQQDGADFKSGSVNKSWVLVDGLSKGHLYSFSLRACKGKAASAYSEALEIDFGPAPDPSSSICTDSPIVLELDAVPQLGSKGYIRIFNSSDKQVDAINLADISSLTLREDGQMVPSSAIGANSVFNTAMDAIPCGSRWRIVHYTPLRVSGKSLAIVHHSGVLDFASEYYLTMDAGVIEGHPGIAKGDFSFSTKAEPVSKTALKVSPDGSADFCTVQGAISYAGSLGKDTPVSITLAEGSYPEMLYIRDKNNLSIKGAGKDKSVIIYGNSEKWQGGTGGGASSKPAVGNAVGTSGGRSLALVENCNALILEDLALNNSFGDPDGQAEALYFNSGNGTHRLTIENCALWSFQDTFECKGQVWVHNSLIAGHCDYIWGSPKACLLENCEIRSRNAGKAGFIVQARITPGDKGFVFLGCNLTAEPGVSDGCMYLARSGGDTNVYDNVTYINCSMSSAIAPGGWYTNPLPTPQVPNATAGWKEYGSKDFAGNALSGHNGSGLYLNADQAADFSSKSAVLGW